MKQSRPGEQGVALVVTVIVVAMLAVVGVAFMQSTSADRAASRSVANYMRAQLAAEAGVGVAGALLASAMTNDHFIVVANANGQLFVGNGSNQPAGTFAYTPAFSTSTSVTSGVAPIIAAGMPATNVPGGTNFVFADLPGGLSVTSPVVSWVYLMETNSAGVVQTNARFAFWAEDLSGKLDLSLAGTNTSSPVARRPTGTSPAELALWALLSSNAASAAASGGAGNDIVSARSNLLTAATVRLVSPAVTPSLLADFAANLRYDTGEPELIPFGFGYADQGRPKYNLNTNLTASSVPNLASVVSRNLPNFSRRSGAMSPTAYVNNLAANIVDYADSDASPTVDNAANPSYLGIENIPWPNELFDRIQFLGVTDAGQIRVELKDWIEVWNMGNRPTAPATVAIDNNYDMQLTFSNSVLRGSFTGNLNSGTFESGAWGRREFSVPALQPNEYRILASSTAPAARVLFWQAPTALVSTNAAIKAAWRIFSPREAETTNMSFRSFLGATVVQQSRGGRWPRHLAPPDALAPSPASPNRHIFCNPVGFATQSGPMSASAVPVHSGGDPRAQLFLSGPLRAAHYKNRYASPGGRNWEAFNIARFPESEVNPYRFWPDSGHIAANERGGVPTDDTQSPDTFTSVNNTNNFVMRRNDSGVFTNILEFGNIYDPLQWRDQAPAGIAVQQVGIWTNLTASATPDARFGGRNTLRVGRWEFSRFTNNGTRASQLLDLFAVGPTNSAGSVINRVAGRVNLNTASTNVLRALAAGVYNSTDPALLPGGTNFAVPTTAVAAFASGVANRRSQRPFSSTTELTTISTNTNASNWPASSVFGGSNVVAVTEWNDAAAEEWFGKVFPLATVRSRNFAVFAIGQALQPGSGKVLSTARAAFQIYMEPQRGAESGLATNAVPRVIRSWSL